MQELHHLEPIRLEGIHFKLDLRCSRLQGRSRLFQALELQEKATDLLSPQGLFLPGLIPFFREPVTSDSHPLFLSLQIADFCIQCHQAVPEARKFLEEVNYTCLFAPQFGIRALLGSPQLLQVREHSLVVLLPLSNLRGQGSELFLLSFEPPPKLLQGGLRRLEVFLLPRSLLFQLSRPPPLLVHSLQSALLQHFLLLQGVP